MTMDAVIERATSQSMRLGHNYVGTEHALLAIVDHEPALLEPYGVTRAKLLLALTPELLRIVVEVRDARSIVEPVRQVAEQYSGTELSAPEGFAGITRRLAAGTLTSRHWTIIQKPGRLPPKANPDRGRS